MQARFFASLLYLITLSVYQPQSRGEPLPLEPEQFTSLDKALDRCADRIRGTLVTEKIDTVEVRPFSSIGKGEDTSVSLGIIKRLKEKHGYKIGPGGLEVIGSIQQYPVDKSKPLAGITINYTLQGGEAVLTSRPIRVLGEQLGYFKFGPSGERIAPPIEGASENPETAPFLAKDSKSFKPSSRSPWTISFHKIGPDGASVSTIPIQYDETKQRYRLRMEKRDRYGIQIYNHKDCKYDIGVQVFIDGLNTSSLAEKLEHQNLMRVVPSGETQMIKGWLKDERNEYDFVVGDLTKTPAFRQYKQNGKGYGTIVLVIRTVWEEGQDAPPHESAVKFSSGGLGTEQGPIRPVNGAIVKRSIGTERAKLEFYYGDAE